MHDLRERHMHECTLPHHQIHSRNKLTWSANFQIKIHNTHGILRCGLASVNKQHRGPAEYKGIANAVVEICFLCNPLLELHCPLSTSTLVFCEDISSVYLSTYEAYSGKKMAMEQVKVLHVPASLQYADIFTKRLPTSLFIDFKSILTVCCTNYLTTGG
ncbi:hypothetical protein YC2023_074257 [Brassica napus]